VPGLAPTFGLNQSELIVHLIDVGSVAASKRPSPEIALMVMVNAVNNGLLKLCGFPNLSEIEKAMPVVAEFEITLAPAKPLGCAVFVLLVIPAVVT
jgi:hypothetical protein